MPARCRAVCVLRAAGSFPEGFASRGVGAGCIGRDAVQKVHDAARTDTVADFDKHACANGRNRQVLGDGVGKRVEEGNGNRDGHETHIFTLPRSHNLRAEDQERGERRKEVGRTPRDRVHDEPERWHLHSAQYTLSPASYLLPPVTIHPEECP